MADQHQYAKKRKEFGRHPQFDDTVTKIVGSVMPNHTQKDLYQQRDPNKLILDNIPQFSEHRVSNSITDASHRSTQRESLLTTAE
jgi:hypothetical protein